MIRLSAAAWVVAALALAPAAAVAQEPDSVLKQCWSPQALGAKPGEHLPVRRAMALDRAALRRIALAPVPVIPPSLRGSIRRVDLPPGKKLIALTFDLCETPWSIGGYDGGIVDYLRAQGIKATFFASGKWLETHAERAEQLIADPLFQIGNHGLEHRDFRHLAGAKLVDELVLAQAAYERTRTRFAARACIAPQRETVLGRLPARIGLFRFPYGTCDAKALDAVAEAGLLAIQWDVVSGDPDPHRSARSIAASVLANTRPGSIIVAHANGRGWHTRAALPLIVPKLREQGYEFVTVGELLAAGEPVIVPSCYELRPGDQRLHTARHPRREPERKRSSGWRAFFQPAD